MTFTIGLLEHGSWIRRLFLCFSTWLAKALGGLGSFRGSLNCFGGTRFGFGNSFLCSARTLRILPISIGLLPSILGLIRFGLFTGGRSFGLTSTTPGRKLLLQLFFGCLGYETKG